LDLSKEQFSLIENTIRLNSVIPFNQPQVDTFVLASSKVAVGIALPEPLPILTALGHKEQVMTNLPAVMFAHLLLWPVVHVHVDHDVALLLYVLGGSLADTLGEGDY